MSEIRDEFDAKNAYIKDGVMANWVSITYLPDGSNGYTCVFKFPNGDRREATFAYAGMDVVRNKLAVEGYVGRYQSASYQLGERRVYVLLPEGER